MTVSTSSTYNIYIRPGLVSHNIIFWGGLYITCPIFSGGSFFIGHNFLCFFCTCPIFHRWDFFSHHPASLLLTFLFLVSSPFQLSGVQSSTSKCQSSWNESSINCSNNLIDCFQRVHQTSKSSN